MENQSTKSISRKIVCLGGVLVVLSGLGFWWLWGSAEHNTVQAIRIGSTIYSQIEVSDTAEERARGLAKREAFCERCAMLFVFERAGQYGFWMKDMRFGIDILWVKDGKVVHKESAIQPENQEIMKPDISADSVIETVPNVDTKVGDRVHLVY